MGESQNQPFQLSFNRFLRVDLQGSRVTSDVFMMQRRRGGPPIGRDAFIAMAIAAIVD